MPRSTTVTLTASAVTLACLAATLYASPQVVAESMGREVHAFSPLDPSTFPGNTTQPTVQADGQDTSRDESTLTNDGSWDVVETESGPTSHPADADDNDNSFTVDAAITEGHADSDDTVADEPTDTQTSRVTSELPQVEVTLPEADEADDGEPSAEDEPNIPDDVDSPDSITVIVNKHRPLPADYAPEDLVELPESAGAGAQQLRAEAAEAATAMFEAAAADGIELTMVSSYRSYAYQQELYDNYVNQYGTQTTNEMSARPGYSEHQTGLSLDVDTPDGSHTLATSFGDTEAGQWLAEHAHDHGFVIRYPEGQEPITGFQYEPWHLRYFGEQYAQQLVEDSDVAEDAFGLDPAPDYED